ncbi:MAG: type II secretion system F family protein [Thermoleophilaceae bacterium]|nr:type II secretion system F family protein [Thermoleophilaceae bacterium]
MTPLLAGAAATLAVLGLAGLIPRARTHARGEPAMRVLAAAGAGLRRGAAPPAGLAERIAAAGVPAGLGPREVTAAKLAGASVLGLFSLPLTAAAPGRLGFLIVLAAPVAGFLAPDLWLARRRDARLRRARVELPALLDLLRVAIDAGAPLAHALGRVGSRAHGPVAAEWRRVAAEVDLGAPLAEALSLMPLRLPCAEIDTLAAALTRAMRHGVPLSDTLAAQARDSRLHRRRRIQEEAAKAGPKIQLVVALLLVPSVMLMVAAALLAALTESGGVPQF